MQFVVQSTILLAALFAVQETGANLCARMGRHLLQAQCVLTGEGGEGPYYLPYHIIKQDIRDNRPGIPFKLKFTVTDVTKCEPMRNVSIDIWQADANGIYSSYTKNSPDRRKRHAQGSPKKRVVFHAPPTDNSTFLRGVQFTDDEGKAEFMTVFPGAYATRTPHIHLMVHLPTGRTVHVTQLYFPDTMNNKVNRLEPYKERARSLAAKNTNDYIFRRDSGEQTVMTNIKPLDGKRLSKGLVGEMILGINPQHESINLLKGAEHE